MHTQRTASQSHAAMAVMVHGAAQLSALICSAQVVETAL